MVTKDFLDSKEYSIKREAMQKEINKNSYLPKDRSSEKWAKTPSEHKELKALISVHKAQMQAKGFNPKKRMNITPPVTGKVW